MLIGKSLRRDSCKGYHLEFCNIYARTLLDICDIVNWYLTQLIYYLKDRTKFGNILFLLKKISRYQIVKMKNAFLLIGILSFTYPSFSQGTGFRGLVAYAEYSAAGTFYSANLEKLIFAKGGWYGNGRIGFGLSNREYNIPVFIPVGVNFCRGKRNSHPEVGLGLSYAEGLQVVGASINQALYFMPSLSYRFQKPGGGFFFKIGYAPYIKIKEFSKPDHTFQSTGLFDPSISMALGYYFGRMGKSD